MGFLNLKTAASEIFPVECISIVSRELTHTYALTGAELELTLSDTTEQIWGGVSGQLLSARL